MSAIPPIAILLAMAAIVVTSTGMVPHAGGGGDAALVGVPDKFDSGFYVKIQNLILEGASATASSASATASSASVASQALSVIPDTDPTHPDAGDLAGHYHVIIQIDGSDEEEIDLNKMSVVDALEAAGSHDIVPANVLSFVTASVPVAAIPGLSLFGEVHMLGDGEAPVVPQVDTARQTIRAGAADLAGLSNNVINGSGVTVAIIDFGINHASLNSKVDARIYCPTGSCALDGGNNTTTLPKDEFDELTSSPATHGTLVAQIVASSDLPAQNGLSPGVRLLDGYVLTRGYTVRALDWALTEGADIANLSISVPSDTCISTHSLNAAINQAVSKGMVVVVSAGNDGFSDQSFVYHTVGEPSCAQNVISVGGMSDRYARPYLFPLSSLGPVTGTTPRLVPHMVAPAHEINLLSSSDSADFAASSGTSFSTPMVSAAAAMMLQLNPDLVPAETKSLLLLGSDWTGPVPCTSSQYEASDSLDDCSHAARRDYTGVIPTLETLNHVGFGVLDVANSLEYAANSSSHVVSDNFDSDTRSMLYGLNVTAPLEQTKVLLTWLVPFFFNYNAADFDFTVTCPGSSEVISAESFHQTVEFAVFEPADAGVCAVHVTARTGAQNFTLASTHPLVSPPSEFIESNIVVSAEDGTYVLNEKIVVNVEFPRPVSVDGAAKPYLELDMNSTVKHAAYAGISADGTALSFEYVVQENDAATDLSYVGTQALVVPDGGNLTDARTGITVRPVLPSPGEEGSLSAGRNITVNASPDIPLITFITRHDPVHQLTANTTLVFRVTFSESVVNVGQSDFALSGGSGTVTRVNGTGSTYLVTVLASSDGIFDLDMSSSNDVRDASSNGLSNTDPRDSNDQTYLVDTTAPVMTAITQHGYTSHTTLVFEVTFSEDVTGVGIGDFELSPGSTGTGSVIELTGSGAKYLVSVYVLNGGTFNLDLVSSYHGIIDAAGNPLVDTDPTGADHTYVADITAPTVTSIKRHDPADETTSAQTLVFEVVFSEDVTGVDAPDFALSPDSTGGGNGTGSDQFTQARLPALAIPDHQTVSDAITVPDSGNATSVFVRTEITHTYIGDLKVDLIAPDGTTRTLHNRTGGITADIDQTYAPDFNGVPISGNWTLRINDNFASDTGTLTRWVLTINYGAGTAGPVTSASGSGNTYHVTVSATTDGTYNLDLASTHDITDSAHNPLTDTVPTTGTDETYTVSTVPIDTTPPTVSSIERYSPADQNTDSQTLIYKVTFSEAVIGVNQADFALSSGSTGTGSIAGLAGSGSTYYVTVSASQDGTYSLDLVSSGHGIEDAASNPLADTTPAGADQTYTVITVPIDTTPPTVSSIERHDPTSENTDSQTLIYEVKFSEAVIGVNQTDFALSPGSTGGAGTGSGQFTQTRSPAIAITQANTITDAIAVTDTGNATSVSVAIDISHTYIGDLKVDLIAPDGTTKILHNRSGGTTDDIDQTYAPDFAGVSIEGTWTLRINDNYAAADDGTLNGWTLTINHGSGSSSDSTAGPVTGLSGSGDTYQVTVSAAQDGTYNLDLVSSGHGIMDTASNPLADTTPAGADQTYTVITVPIDTTPPTVSSIERHDPTSENTDSQTLIYEVKFSEAVIGVNQTDFALSPGSTGGAGTGSGQFTQTRSPAIAITQANTITDAIAVTDTGNATSVSVAIDISHTYIGDLKVDLIAPDGTTKILHNRSGGTTDDIDQTYAPDFAGVSIEGTWTLRINDNYAAADDGTLNGWTLTINHGSGSSSDSTAGPVTGLSGSGDTYQVTVSAAQDGTYNLDLVSSGHGIMDTASNPLADTTPAGADQTYTVSTVPIDTTPPTVSSIERHDPTSENTDSQTLIYEVKFSEAVIGVNQTDFALSPGSTGGAGTGSGQFTQTRSPAIAITQANTITDAIAVTDTGNATSVSVAIDISHTYIGDLKVDLIAPDGTTKILHNRSGGTTDDIDQTYAPDFAGVSIEGTWTLRINDNYAAADDGTLNGWTLTINHGSGSSSDSTAGPVTGLSGSGDTYQVTVSAAQDGTYNLDLVSSGHGIMDTASNPLADTTPAGADQTYTVITVPIDTTPPTVSSIERHDPTSENTDSQTLIYEVKFSEAVIGVNQTDFALSPGSTGGAGTGSGQFTQTRSPAIAITQANTITDAIAVTDTGNATSVSVAIDISHTYIGDLKVDLIAPDGTTKILHNRSGGTTDDIDQTYAPDFAGVSIEGTWTLRINDNYAAADDGTLNGWTLTINHGSGSSSDSTAGPVTGLSGSGDTYQVTVSAAQDGTYNLDLVSSGHGIMDTASNPLADTTPAGADQTYTVSTTPADTTSPTVSSIERHDPTSENTDSQTLIYEVKFSEAVIGVNQTDFALSPGSTGGAGTGSGQFTQTRSPAIAITQANTITDAIAVTDTGNATSVSVAIDISHTYIGDLKVDLIAPDGTTKILHNRSGGTTDDIDQTYAPDFAGVSIEGTWTLRINDNYAAADDGTLNGWTLTINHGSGSSSDSTAGPVTGLSGSGDTYQVTVSASQDGTYNLDLVSSGHGIMDTASNPLADTTPAGADQTYTVSTTPADTTSPTVSSIERHDPTSENTDSQTLIYEVKFSEAVIGVNQTDFALSPGSTGGAGTGSGQFTQTRSPAIAITQANTITDAIAVTDTGNATSVSVAIDISHTYIGDLKVDLIAPDGTTKILHNRSGGTTDDIDQTYAPDFAGVSIEGTWTLRINDNYAAADDGTLNGWTLTINHGSGSSSDSTAGPVTGLSGSGDTYQVTVSASQDGTYNLDLVSSGHGIMDTASNPLADTTPAGADQTYTVITVPIDTTPPTVSSIERHDPTSENTDSQTLIYEVKFSEAVIGVNQTDFALSPGSTGGAGTGSGQFTQTRSPAIAITQANTITDAIAVTDTGNATSVSVAIDISHTYIGDLKVDLIAPDGTTKILHNRSGGTTDDIDQTYAPDFAGVSIEGTWTLRINDNYAAADDGTLNGWTLTINHGSGSSSDSTAGPVTGLSGSGDTYQVTVSAAQDGTYNLDLVSSGHGIMDTASNPLADTTPAGADQTYTVITVPIDTTPPTVSSIERHDPTSENTDSQTLIYEVKFSEAVIGVNQTDFALSPGSTGGAGTGSGQFTQTRSPAIAITQANTITDAIAVTDTGNATSVSVAIDISHTYIGDLKVDLIAPDGTTKILHNRSGGTTDDIDQTYAPDFAGVSIEGTWTLRINDNYAAADDGTLNGWTLTINHGSTAGTTNPVTSVSGSGDTYHVTVSASTDGTYNLDLVSGHGIADESSNQLADTAPTGADHTYTVGA